MRMKNEELLKNVLIVGSGGSFLISTFLATVVFDNVSPNSTLPAQEIEMGMTVQATDQHIEVFMDVGALRIQTLVDILNISKVDEDGGTEEGTVADLFPVGSPATGRGTLMFRIKSLTKAEMPNLANLSQTTVPMAWVREETLTPFLRSVLKLAAVGIKSFSLLVWMGVCAALGSIGLGVVLLFLGKSTTPVEVVETGNADNDE